MEGQEALGNFAMNVGDYLDDFEQEISDGGPQIAMNREQILKDYIDSKKNPETVKKNEERSCNPAEMAARLTGGQAN